MKHSQGTRRVLLLGGGISRSISPVIQNSAFLKLGLDVRYHLLDLKEREFDLDIEKILNSEDLIGLNVTVPFKERIIKHLSEIDSRSSAIGAVNTVKISESESTGFNTDCDGVLATLSSLGIRHDRRRKYSIVMGAGGAARACVYSLAKCGFDSVFVLNRTHRRAKALADHLALDFPRLAIDTATLSVENLSAHLKECDLLINATPTHATSRFLTKIDLSRAKETMRVFDLGYKEPGPLLESASKRGLRSSDGLLMLVEQAARSIEIWTGLVAPRKDMMKAAIRARREIKN